MKVLRSAIIFCQVIDNFGDAGVCWRLARQFAQQEKLQVTLWIDDLRALQHLRPGLDTALQRQECDGFTICRWEADGLPDINGADLVIEAFGCRLSDAIVAAMADRETPPVWINLEYLSAEKWVEQSHRLPSPHPRYALTKYFYFPGFSSATGGLLKESFVDARRAAMTNDDKQRQAFAQKLGLSLNTTSTLVSLFCYPYAPVQSLLSAMQTASPVTCLIPAGVATSQLADYFSVTPQAGMQFQRGVLTCHIVPFLEPDDFDSLLALCDVNFVRGEDSFVRAQWAARPLIWQAYPQEQAVHLEKVQSFLDVYLRHCAPGAAQVLRQFIMRWNGGSTQDLDWMSLQSQLTDLQNHAGQWCLSLSGQTELAHGLIHYAAQLRQSDAVSKRT